MNFASSSSSAFAHGQRLDAARNTNFRQTYFQQIPSVVNNKGNWGRTHSRYLNPTQSSILQHPRLCKESTYHIIIISPSSSSSFEVPFCFLGLFTSQINSIQSNSIHRAEQSEQASKASKQASEAFRGKKDKGHEKKGAKSSGGGHHQRAWHGIDSID